MAESPPRSRVYTTNAVKHFKWRPRGGRRLHQSPRVGEIEACRPWLEAELEAVAPRAVVALGATAARALFGPDVKVTKDRGRLLDAGVAPVEAVTMHPSAIVRVPDGQERGQALAALAQDLELVATQLGR